MGTDLLLGNASRFKRFPKKCNEGLDGNINAAINAPVAGLGNILPSFSAHCGNNFLFPRVSFPECPLFNNPPTFLSKVFTLST